MVIPIKQHSPLVTQPLKTSPATGATLATLGFSGSIPLMHGSQGCSAFTKVYLIQHLREPIPLQNTAIDQVSAVMGGEGNISEALQVLCEKHSPELIVIMSTGLTEMQGVDLYRIVTEFTLQYPQYSETSIVPVITPDFIGSMQTGYAHTVRSIVKQLVKGPTGREKQRTQVNVLCSIGMTSADIETIKRYVEAFDLDSVIVPDLSLSLDGHLGREDFSATSSGGTSVLEIELMVDSSKTLVFGESLEDVARWLNVRFGIHYRQFGMAMNLDSIDPLIMTLSEISGRPVPGWITRERQRLQDALLDVYFLLSGEQYTIALEPDLAKGYVDLITMAGGEVSQVVTTLDVPSLQDMEAREVIVGDLSCIDLANPDLTLVIGNSHCANVCESVVPVMRVGFPCFDQFGNMDIKQVGYEGARQRLFSLANLLLHNHKDEVTPHVSAYRFSAHDVLPTAEGL
ncbi:nitrogenase iron-molybdenum cofactor biosynthesis protein NifN [Vibrio cincinnatiensis]|uniref:nitrogenase iron-molybdenum cofactor biosynthesis protein NifN n=1 Tax=Vibrio cincinnatiensis TaxID=675 RepID=UPI001EDD2EDA|nr:nitrogenase iron-molybdenum cofactor biosynthesis protein NifN [Vibrio cincinnatiensis]MCG3724267.1 nitrogenase iron-molybdenum cofactor biosynthesis protein NifN [Vibrio cincinnatiensis]